MCLCHERQGHEYTMSLGRHCIWRTPKDLKLASRHCFRTQKAKEPLHMLASSLVLREVDYAGRLPKFP